jgi:hypothetical protein
VAEVLQSHGVKFLFTLPGGHISPVLVAAEAAGIRVVDTRHEVCYQFSYYNIVILWLMMFGCIPIDS